MRSNKTKPNKEILISKLDYILSNPKDISLFICHAGDADNIVAKVQQALADEVNSTECIIRWSARDWKKMDHLQRPDCGDCQDMINKEIDKANYIIFIIQNRIGHYTLREWFYCIERISTKHIYLFINRNLKESDLYRIKSALGYEAYVQPYWYSGSKDIIHTIEKKIGKIEIRVNYDEIRNIIVKMDIINLRRHKKQIGDYLKSVSRYGLGKPLVRLDTDSTLRIKDLVVAQRLSSILTRKNPMDNVFNRAALRTQPRVKGKYFKLGNHPYGYK